LLIQPEEPLLDESLAELLDDPLDGLLGSLDEVCACVANTAHAAQNTIILSSCFLINCFI